MVPLVQSRVEFTDDLFPLPTCERGEEFRLLDRVLRVLCERKHCGFLWKMLTIVRSADARMWLSFR